MRIKQWVELRDEVEIDIDARDITAALYEAFQRVKDSGENETATRSHVLSALNTIAGFLNGISPEIIELMTEGQRKTIAAFLQREAARYVTWVRLPSKEA